VAVDELAAKFHFGGGVAEEWNAALTAVGVSGKLEVERVGLMEFVKGVGLMNEGENRGVLLMSLPGPGWIGMASPDRIEPIDEDVLAFDVKIGSGIGEESHACTLDFFLKGVTTTVPTVVISRARDDSVGRREAFECAGELGK